MLRGGYALGGKGSGIVDDARRTRRRRCGARSPAAHAAGARRGVPARLEGDRVRGRARRRATTASPSATWRTSIRWASTPASRSSSRRRRRSNDDGVPAAALDRDQDRSGTSASSASATSSTRSIRTALDYRVIEVNARLSRSSALASKATGYPLAYVAAKLALGYSLPEIPNGITRRTTAFFEPALDYLVCKVPRWDLGKFQRRVDADRQRDEERRRGDGDRPHVPRGASRRRCACSTSASTGSIRTRSRSTDLRAKLRMRDAAADLRDRARRCGRACRSTRSTTLTRIDPLVPARASSAIVAMHATTRRARRAARAATLLRDAKRLGFSDRAIERLDRTSRAGRRARRARRHGIRPAASRRSTRLAAEFPAETNYLYSTYHATADRRRRRRRRKKILVLGSGAYRIGSSVEFDWCRVNAAQGGRGARLRDDHAQLQPGDGQHRLRRLRPAGLRRDQPRDRARAVRARAAATASSSAWAARSRTTWRCGWPSAGVPILGTSAGEHRPRRGPREVQRAARRARHRPAAVGRT